MLTLAVSCGTSHVSTVSTPLRWIFTTTSKNIGYKKLVTHIESHASTMSLLERGAIYKQSTTTTTATTKQSKHYSHPKSTTTTEKKTCKNKTNKKPKTKPAL